jgi:ribosomal protein S18 acetylase RimI-like enzyme
MSVQFTWRGAFTNAEINVLHAEGFGHRVLDEDRVAQVERHSLGWVCARDATGLVGFVNLPWDGGVHAFIVDTVVARRAQRRGIATRLVAIAAGHARAAGCAWLHVDFQDGLAPLYLETCGFRHTPAGLVQLRGG